MWARYRSVIGLRVICNRTGARLPLCFARSPICLQHSRKKNAPCLLPASWGNFFSEYLARSNDHLCHYIAPRNMCPTPSTPSVKVWAHGLVRLLTLSCELCNSMFVQPLTALRVPLLCVTHRHFLRCLNELLICPMKWRIPHSTVFSTCALFQSYGHQYNYHCGICCDDVIKYRTMAGLLTSYPFRAHVYLIFIAIIQLRMWKR